MKYIIILTLLMTACGNPAVSSIDAITCDQMKALAAKGLMPATQEDRDELRRELGQAVADELHMGVVTVFSYCDY